ncbi:unnamed protein product [Moneuplotes crassus]|uniref:Uncharacterized protein n=1 Tax=Euplotes crassus TaxID=5936 RepID=A0AAD1Y1T6_EUPCR|nr:unnamed protein product [Moneuplotes crassus]
MINISAPHHHLLYFLITLSLLSLYPFLQTLFIIRPLCNPTLTQIKHNFYRTTSPTRPITLSLPFTNLQNSHLKFPKITTLTPSKPLKYFCSSKFNYFFLNFLLQI